MSVIVPTYNRAALLAETVAELQDQLARFPGAAELLVVDNNCVDETPLVLRRLDREGPFPVRIVPEGKQGLSAARNGGIRAARGRLLFFTDDDVLPAADWVARFAAAFEDPQVTAAGGRVLPLWPEEVPSWIGPREKPRFPGVVGHFDLGDAPRWLLAGDPQPLGANMGFRREVFERVGGFREDLGRAGGSLAGGEDMEFYRRVLDRCGRLAYRPEAVVHHRVTPRMLRRGYVLRCLYGGGKSVAAYPEDAGAPRLFGLPRYALRMAAGDALRLLREAVTLDHDGAFLHLARLANNAGYLAGCARLRKGKR